MSTTSIDKVLLSLWYARSSLLTYIYVCYPVVKDQHGDVDLSGESSESSESEDDDAKVRYMFESYAKLTNF